MAVLLFNADREPSVERLPAPAGFTLLEVLVACGILVFALSGIAAILPAASSRLADAAVQDRAGSVSANAFSEVTVRGINAAQRFSDASAANKALAFGRPLQAAIDNAALLPESKPTPAGKILLDSLATYNMKEFWPDSDTRGFLSEDDLQFSFGAAGFLSSLYESVDTLGAPTGPRRFKAGVCWGALLIPKTLSSAAARGMPATLSIVTFRKPPEARVITLTSTGVKNGLYSLPAGDLTTHSTFAKACSYVLALPPTMNASPPKWLRVNSSWVRSSDRVPFVMFVNDPNEIGSYETSSGLTVVGFTGLLRVDEYPVVLE